jgi:hypothetical protein
MDPPHFRPYLHKSKKPEPDVADPNQSQKLGAVEHHNGAMKAHPGAVEAHPGAMEPWSLGGSVGQWLQMQNHLDEEPDPYPHQSKNT